MTPPDSSMCSETGGQKEKIFNTLELAWPDPCISIQSIFFNVKIQSIRGSFLVFSASSLVFSTIKCFTLPETRILAFGGGCNWCHFILTPELDSDSSTNLFIQNNDILFCTAFDLTVIPRNFSFPPRIPS